MTVGCGKPCRENETDLVRGDAEFVFKSPLRRRFDADGVFAPRLRRRAERMTATSVGPVPRIRDLRLRSLLITTMIEVQTMNRLSEQKSPLQPCSGGRPTKGSRLISANLYQMQYLSTPILFL